MGSALVVALVKYGLLALLWVFVLLTVRAVREDLWGRRPAPAAAPVALGRGHDCTLVLDDDYASTHHARLVPDGEKWMLEDLGSTNGTYLGRAKVARPTAVPLGTPIRIGETSLELRS